MSYAIKTGTTQAVWIDQAATPVGSVRFDGTFPTNPIWDSGLNNIREMTQTELDALPAQLVTAAHPALVAALTDSKNFQAKLLKSFVLTALDELNLHTTFEAAMLSAVAAASSLADLKTRFAAITPVPQRTKANLITAMTNQINAGNADA